jgi:hypothetical protein
MWGEYSSTIVLQDAATEAGDGVAVSIAGIDTFLVQVSGTYTGMQVNFEASLDDGATWAAVALLPVGSTTPGTLVATPAAAATGIYRMTHAPGFSHFRVRVSGTGTGDITVTVYGVRQQAQWLPDPPPEEP